jgi:hypothetical protein
MTGRSKLSKAVTEQKAGARDRTAAVKSCHLLSSQPAFCADPVISGRNLVMTLPDGASKLSKAVTGRVARMERSDIRGHVVNVARRVPGFAPLNPGYKAVICCHGVAG